MTNAIIIYIYGFIIIASVFAYGNGLLETIPIPEPATLLLLGIGMIGFAGYGRKRLKK